MPEQPSGSFLTSKIGPLPVYAWAGAILGIALLYARFTSAKADKAAAAQQQPASTYSSEPAGTVPQFIIQNELPPYIAPGGGAPSAPVTPPVTAPPIVTPPGTSATPPVTTGPIPTPVLNPVHAPGAPAPAAQWYTVQHGDTLSSIAARYGTTADKIFQYNTTPGNRNATAIATIRQRGPNLIYAGESFLIPPK